MTQSIRILVLALAAMGASVAQAGGDAAEGEKKAATCAAAPGTRATTDWPRMLPTGGRHPERMATLDATTRSAGEPGRRTALRDRKSPRCGDGNKSEKRNPQAPDLF